MAPVGVVKIMSILPFGPGFSNQRKWKRIHDERLDGVLKVHKQYRIELHWFFRTESQLRSVRVEANQTLGDAAIYLHAVAKQYTVESLPYILSEISEEWLYEKQVDARLKRFAYLEKKLLRKITAMQTSILRIEELQEITENTDRALRDLLGKARGISAPVLEPMQYNRPLEPDLHLPHQIYLTAKTLRELIEQPGISEDTRRIIEE